ncbi:MAG TPA: bifunctional riboflavin kinase/FAD synthetase [Anaerolineae bacterium]|nr:bifunctional riboflavin kinase/FAD synthetase [Anaerolineae bacterium]
MIVLDDLGKAPLRQETILTIGAFDGVHRGHRALIQSVVNRARATDRLAALITFHPHPALVLSSDPVAAAQGFYLTTPGEKLVLLEGLGLDLVALLPFDRALAGTPASDFMRAVAHHLRARELWVGPDFALGRKKEGDIATLQELGRELGYEVSVLRPVVDLAKGQSTVSSSRIRAALRDGHVGEAAEMLGRYFSVSGEVVSGARRGRKLGFPTANLQVRPERALPANGVYAVYAVLGDVCYPAVANVGVRPSFDNGPRTLETHLLDYEDDIYGCDLKVEFVARLREERRFESPAALAAQVQRDLETARIILRAVGTDAVPGNGVSCPSAREAEVPCHQGSEEVEHTADLALRVWGRELCGLFAEAGRGMYRLMADVDGLAATRWREIRLEAMDRESLLVSWLNELLFITESEGLLFVEFICRSVTETSLVAWVGGMPGHATRSPVKAATFHDLAVLSDDAGWSALITFDA